MIKTIKLSVRVKFLKCRVNRALVHEIRAGPVTHDQLFCKDHEFCFTPILRRINFVGKIAPFLNQF